MMECLALTSILWQAAGELPQCGSVSLDVAGRGWMRLPKTGIPTDFALHRAGIGLGFAQGDLHGRVQIGHIQTGGTNSYIGIGGESNVYRIQLASVQYRPIDSLQLSAGIVEDLWVESGNHTWGYRNIEATATEQLAWMERGNAGVSGVWSSPRLVIATSMHTGEGAFRRERNAGKNTALYMRWNVLEDGFLSLELYGQDGSYGFGSQPNHRAGVRLASNPIKKSWNVGVSALQAWGVLGDGAYQPLLLEGWGTVQPVEWIRLLTRIEHATFNQERSTALMLGLSHPIDPQGNLGLYWKTWSHSDGWTEIAGSDAAMSTHQLIVQLDGRFQQSRLNP